MIFLSDYDAISTWTAGVTVGIVTGIYWFSSSISNLLTPLIIGSPLQLHGLFYIVSGLNLFGFLLILFAFPETKVLYYIVLLKEETLVYSMFCYLYHIIILKGVSLERMDELFSQSIWENFIRTFR